VVRGPTGEIVVVLDAVEMCPLLEQVVDRIVVSERDEHVQEVGAESPAGDVEPAFAHRVHGDDPADPP
jgi:hypothetical protein